MTRRFCARTLRLCGPKSEHGTQVLNAGSTLRRGRFAGSLSAIDRLLKPRGTSTRAKRTKAKSKLASKGHKSKVAPSIPGAQAILYRRLRRISRTPSDPESVFYDSDYQSELARPNLDTLLQSIYNENAELVVVFLSQEYADKEWCGLEWRAIRELSKRKG